jgi:hypothetical protein
LVLDDIEGLVYIAGDVADAQVRVEHLVFRAHQTHTSD